MRRLFLLLALCQIHFVSAAQQSDSLYMTGLVKRARTQMNIDALAGKKVIDSLAAFLDARRGFKFFYGERDKLLGVYYYRLSQYDSAEQCYRNAMTIYEALGNELETAKILVNLSMVYNRKSDYARAIEYAIRSLRLFEKSGDKKGMGAALNIVGIVYFQQKDYPAALQYFRKYLNNASSARDSVEIASGYTNIGATFSELVTYDSALYYHKNALRLHKKLNNAYGTGNALQNIAFVFKNNAAPDSALQYYTEASDYYRKVRNTAGLTEVQLNIGVLYNEIGQYRKAISFLEPALELSELISEDLLRQQAFKSLSVSYENLGNHGKALHYYKFFHAANDSIFNDNNRKNIEEIKTKYETEKKEQQIALQDAQLAEQKSQILWTYSIISALLVMLTLVVIIFLLLRSRLKRKQQILEKEKELKVREAFVQASIQSQENERKRFAQDLHDGMGQLISSLRLSLSQISSDSSLEHRMTQVSKAENLLSEMHREIRSIAFNLMPQTLVQFGLLPALKEVSDRINNAGTIVVRVQGFGIPERLSELQEISVYRITQEWVNNVIKYAKATLIEIQLVGFDHELTITIEDNGNGFDTASLEQSAGNGWKNIHSRLNLLKGSLELDSNPGRRGTTMVLRVPLAISKSVREHTVAIEL